MIFKSPDAVTVAPSCHTSGRLFFSAVLSKRYCRSTFVLYGDNFAVLPSHMAALHQQQQQRSRMLGLMQSTAAQTAVSQPQYPPAAAPRMTLQGGTSSAARNLFSSPTESSATNSDSFYYPRQPVLIDEFLNAFLQFC